MNHICFNGKIRPAAEPVLTADSRGYRYGDGLFETMKVHEDRIVLETLHFERLFSGLALLKMSLPVHVTAAKLREEILRLCTKNKCGQLARVRLSVSRGTGGLYDGNPSADYIIECWSIDASVNRLNENGLVIDIYPDARKSCDPFSRLKSASFQPYVMAALYAREKQWNDCLVLNTAGNIADSTVANLFLVKDGTLFTPASTEGCIDGVMRKYLIAALSNAGEKVRETIVTVAMLKEADELFLTNAIKGIRWVKQFGDRLYKQEHTARIYDRFGRTFIL